MRLAMEPSNDANATDASPTAAGIMRMGVSKRKAYKPVKFTGCFGEPVDSSQQQEEESQPSTLNCLGISATSSERRALHLSHEDTADASNQTTPFNLNSTPAAPANVTAMHSTPPPPTFPLPRQQQIPLSQQTHIHDPCLSQKQRSRKARASAPTMVPLAHHNSSDASPVRSNRRRTEMRTQRNTIAICQIKCNQCEDVFDSMQELHAHTISVHGHYRCRQCNTKFTQRSNLLRHSLKHEGRKPFACTACAKCYYRRDHLQRHLNNLHPDIPPGEGIHVLPRGSQI